MKPTTAIALANPGALVASRREEIEIAIEGVLRSGQYVLGEQVTLFEAEFAAYLEIPYCIAVGSGTDALRLALLVSKVGVGDEVITTTHTSVATISAIEQVGARPVLVDIDPHTRCIDPNRIERAISARTRALIVVHIYGQAAEMQLIAGICSPRGISLVEDCAQATGARYHGRPVGGFGDLGAFSFYPTKNLPALGDGGALVTADPDIALRVRRLRQYGWDQAQISLEPGINSRLDEIQAAVLRVNLRYLEHDNRWRRSIADRYNKVLDGSEISAPLTSNDCLHAMHLYVVELDRRNELGGFLASRGVQTGLHYPLAIHQQPAYQALTGGPFPVAERLYRRMLTLPMHPTLSGASLDQICDALEEWCQQEDSKTND